ncbi:MAG: DUF2239 family protein [Hyphomonadaceae bacterium]|mgnify:FL=1|nr:DUF2239 family protein [Hyphomonadaceae bacterium]
MTTSPAAIAFEGERRIAVGGLIDVAMAVRKRVSKPTHENIHVFDYTSGKTLHLDLSGSEKDVRARLAAASAAAMAAVPEDAAASAPRGPGRPKLGVVPREVTLLPRHWDWLNAQPGGASVALRKLVEEARKTRGQSDTLRARQEAAYRFLSAIAGDWRNYEEANRALFAGDAVRFQDLTEPWPADVRDHARHLASAAFSARKT